MPWTAADAESHIKDLTGKQKQVWARIANERLAACLAGGGKRETCEASAIRQANSVAKGVRESMKFTEAATVKSRIQGLMRAADALLADKDLPKAVRDDITGFRTKLKKRWDDFEEKPETETGKPGTKAADEAARFIAEAKTIIDTANSFESRERLVQTTLAAKYPPPADRSYDRPWIRELTDDMVIFRTSDENAKLLQASYSIDRTGAEPKVLLGEPKEVEVAYVTVEAVPHQEAVGDTELSADFIPLVEKAVRKDGTIALKVIEPGWGSSGFYSEDMLKRDGPQVFKAGTQMFWDHPTVTEEAERPERSLRDLAGQLTTDAAYRADGPAGPGLYAEAKVHAPYREALNDLSADIGTSIRGIGKGKQGTIAGRTGPVIERIVAAKSVDFVTRPGAGGQVLQLFEAARGRSSPLHIAAMTMQELKRTRPDLIEELRTEIKAAVYGDSTKTKEERKLDEAQIKQLTEAKVVLETENTRLRETILQSEAARFVTEALASVKLPDLTKTRLTEALVKAPVVKDGKLDAEGYKQAIEAAVKAEADYLGKVTSSGKVTGMGAGEPTPVKLSEAWERFYANQGKTPEEAKRLAALAAEQRR